MHVWPVVGNVACAGSKESHTLRDTPDQSWQSPGCWMWCVEVIILSDYLVGESGVLKQGPHVPTIRTNLSLFRLVQSNSAKAWSSDVFEMLDLVIAMWCKVWFEPSNSPFVSPLHPGDWIQHSKCVWGEANCASWRFVAALVTRFCPLMNFSSLAPLSSPQVSLSETVSHRFPIGSETHPRAERRPPPPTPD